MLNYQIKARLLVTIRSELTAQVLKEEREKARLEEEAREQIWREAGGGAFPTLGGGAVPKPAAEAPRRVMSLNPKTGKIQMTAYVKRDSPASSRPTSPTPDVDDIGRIAAPRTAYPTPAEREERRRVVLGERAAQGRAFLDVGGLQLRYYEKRVLATPQEAGGQGDDGKKKRRRGRNKGKGEGGGDGGETPVVEPTAAGSGLVSPSRAPGEQGKGKNRETLPPMSSKVSPGHGHRIF